VIKLLAKISRKWLQLAHIFGNIQITIALTLVYWLLLAPMAVVLKLVSDPLVLRRPRRPEWGQRRSSPYTLDGMKKQF
jgi:hypothetical protein